MDNGMKKLQAQTDKTKNKYKTELPTGNTKYTAIIQID
jgi:hypothetical protein